jgi:hypothetical protein
MPRAPEGSFLRSLGANLVPKYTHGTN